MSLMERLQSTTRTFPLAAPRCSECFELLHLTTFAVDVPGPYFHAGCAQRRAAAAGVRVVTRRLAREG